MAFLVKHRLTDGAIVSLWEATPPTLLDSQIVLDDGTHGYLFLVTDVPLLEVLEGHYIRQQMLLPKTVLTLTAAPATFPADGVSECRVSVAPFVPCTLLVQGEAVSLTTDDPVLVLTADTPQTFYVALDPQAAYRAEPLIVEAT